MLFKWNCFIIFNLLSFNWFWIKYDQFKYRLLIYYCLVFNYLKTLLLAFEFAFKKLYNFLNKNGYFLIKHE